MKWLILFVPLNLFGGWSSDWDALEDYVNGVADQPPRFVTTNLVYELQLAMLERAHSINATSYAVTNLSTIGRFNADNRLATGFPSTYGALRQIDYFLYKYGHYFAPDTWLDGSGQPTAAMLEYCTFEDFDAYDDDEFLSCNLPDGPASVGSVTLPGWTGPHNDDTGFFYGNTLQGGEKYMGITKVWEAAEGYPDKLALWKYQNTDDPEWRDTLSSVWSFIENPGFSGGLLGECIYTVTNVYTSGEDVHYQVGWKYSKHDSFYKLFRTNDWSGADSLVRAKLSVPTGTLPSVSFTVEGFAINTDDWFTYENQTESTRDSSIRHMSPMTNTFSASGAGVTTYTLPVYMDLTDLACASTIDTTDIASVEHLGSTLAVEWYGSKPSYSIAIEAAGYLESDVVFDRPARGSVFANVHALVCRKWILQAMDLTIHFNSLAATNSTTFSVPDPTNSYAAAQAIYDVVSTSSSYSRNLTAYINATFRCFGTEFSPELEESYRISGFERGVAVKLDGGHPLNPGIGIGVVYSNLTASAVYCFAADKTGPSVGDGFTNWENETPNASRLAYYTVAIATGVGEGHIFYIEPGDISFPPTPSTAGERWSTGYARSVRGYQVEVLEEMLIDWGYEYD